VNSIQIFINCVCNHQYFMNISEVTLLQDGSLRVRFPMRSLSFQLTSFPQFYGPRVDSASNKNEYQQSSWRLRLTILPPSASRLSRENVRASTSHNPMCLHGRLQG
jgi:hypothetical protein